MTTLVLLRHARAADTSPGRRDTDRPLTTEGQAQAVAVGDAIRSTAPQIDLVLCSTAQRCRQTLSLTGIGISGTWTQVNYQLSLYNAGADSIIAAIRGLPGNVATALVVGHAPGIPSVATELADPESSEASALAAIAHRFPPATLAVLRFTGTWADLSAASLVAVVVPPG